MGSWQTRICTHSSAIGIYSEDIVNAGDGPGFRIDFGHLSLASAKATEGRMRGVASAYVAGVIPDDGSFWKVVGA